MTTKIPDTFIYEREHYELIGIRGETCCPEKAGVNYKHRCFGEHAVGKNRL